VAGCHTFVPLPFDKPVGPELSGKVHSLRYRRSLGPPDRYQAKYELRSSSHQIGDEKNMVRYIAREYGRHTVDEEATAELLFYTTGKTEGARPFDRVVIVRRELERSRRETTVSGNVESRSDTRVLQPQVTPNVEAELGTDKSYIAVSELGRIAMRRDTPYHYARYDSLCYPFPFLPEETVGIGDKWSYDHPVLVGDGGASLVVRLRADFKLADVRRLDLGPGREGPVCAVIDYSYYGVADDRGLSAAAPGGARMRSMVEGKGKAYFAIEAGKVVWKHEKYRIQTDSERLRRATPAGSRDNSQPEQLRETYEQTMEFSERLLGSEDRPTGRPDRVDR